MENWDTIANVWNYDLLYLKDRIPLSATNNQFKQIALKSAAGLSIPNWSLRNGYSGIIAASYNTSRRMTSSAERYRRNSSVKSKVYSLYHIKVNKQYYFQRCIWSSLSHHGRVWRIWWIVAELQNLKLHLISKSHQSRSRSTTASNTYTTNMVHAEYKRRKYWPTNM